jgi:uncharacterized protein (TIGR03067 family)
MTAPHATLLDGSWQLLRAELDGEAAPELVTMGVVLRLREGGYAVKFKGHISDAGTFELGGTGVLSTIVLRGTKGTNAGRIIPGIYQQRGDLLRLCYGLGGEAPTEFTTAAGQKRYLATYRRTEDKTTAPLRRQNAGKKKKQ